MGSYAAYSYPATGPGSVYGAPSAATGGMSSVTQVTNLIDTGWASSAADQAASSAAECCQRCVVLDAVGASGSAGSSLLAPSAGLVSSALDGGPGGSFNLDGASGVAGAASAGLASAAAGLGVLVAVTSVAGGLAEAHGNSSSAAAALVGAAVAAGSAAAAVSALRLATQLANSTSASTPLFSGVLGLAAAGQVGSGDPSIGRVMSGSLGELQLQVPSVNVLGAVPQQLAALDGGQEQLASSASSVLGYRPVLPTSATAADFASSYPAGPTSGLPGASVGDGIQAQAAALSAAVGAAVSAAQAAAASAVSSLLPVQFGSPSVLSAPRAQGLQLVDGAGYAAAQPTSQAAALAAALAALPAAASPGRYASGSLGGAGLFSPGSAGAAVDSMGNISCAQGLAGLGAYEPAAGDLLSASFSAVTGLAGDVADLIGDSLAAGSALLADSCAFASALSQALGAAVSAAEAAGELPSDVSAALSALQQTLEARAEAYLASAQQAYAQAEQLLPRLLLAAAASAVSSVLPAVVLQVCPQGSGPAASCC